MTAKILEFKRRDPPSLPLPDPEKSKLLPCPFCGSAPRLSNGERVGAASTDMACYIACSNPECNVMTPYFYKRNDRAFHEVIAVWNRRAR